MRKHIILIKSLRLCKKCKKRLSAKKSQHGYNFCCHTCEIEFKDTKPIDLQKVCQHPYYVEKEKSDVKRCGKCNKILEVKNGLKT